MTEGTYRMCHDDVDATRVSALAFEDEEDGFAAAAREHAAGLVLDASTRHGRFR